MADQFLDYARVVLGFSPESVIKYRDCLRQVARILQDPPLTAISKSDVYALRADLVGRQLSSSRQTSILMALKRFLEYGRDEHGLATMDTTIIQPVRQPRREVSFLSAAEVERIVGCLRLDTTTGARHRQNLRLRALIEVLLGTGMRISEALSLNRAAIDATTREARIIGKGNKQRVVFFTERALHWLQEYLDTRQDKTPAAFATIDGTRRLQRADIWRSFHRLQKAAGINKRVTPHILRHTAATQLLFNGCPVGHIKEILGHERLETTCRYYLGLDRRAAKAAHAAYLTY